MLKRPLCSVTWSRTEQRTTNLTSCVWNCSFTSSTLLEMGGWAWSPSSADSNHVNTSNHNSLLFDNDISEIMVKYFLLWFTEAEAKGFLKDSVPVSTIPPPVRSGSSPEWWSLEAEDWDPAGAPPAQDWGTEGDEPEITGRIGVIEERDVRKRYRKRQCHG